MEEKGKKYLLEHPELKEEEGQEGEAQGDVFGVTLGRLKGILRGVAREQGVGEGD